MARPHASHLDMSVSQDEANTQGSRTESRGERWSRATLELLDSAVPPLIHEPTDPAFDFNLSAAVSVTYNLESPRTHLGTLEIRRYVSVGTGMLGLVAELARWEVTDGSSGCVNELMDTLLTTSQSAMASYTKSSSYQGQT